MYEQNFGMDKSNLKHNLIPMHDCARLDMESYIYMLRNTGTKRPKKQCIIHNLSLVYLETILRVKKNKRTSIWSATHQADTERKTHNNLQDSTCDSEHIKQAEL